MKLFTILLFSMFLGVSAAQIEIVDWNYEITSEEGETYLTIKGDIKPGWVIYSQNTDAGGPIPTTITISESDGYILEGELEEKSDIISEFSDLFELNVKKFKGEAVFVQKLLNYKTGTVVSGEIEFMCCDKSKCLPPKTISFEVKG